MTNETFKDIEKLESDLWEAADHLRANSKLTSSDYFMPVLGVIFLRHAANRFAAVSRIGTVGVVSMTSARAQFNQQINAVVPFEGTYGYYLFFAFRDLKEAMRPSVVERRWAT